MVTVNNKKVTGLTAFLWGIATLLFVVFTFSAMAILFLLPIIIPAIIVALIFKLI